MKTKQVEPYSRFGRLTTLDEPHKIGKYYVVTCECGCGVVKDIYTSSLLSGRTQSCGCLQKERASKHGRSNTPTFNAWYGMVRRCTDSSYERYEQYGAIGISVCDQWLEFSNFLADMGERPENHTIDRVDNDKGYYPENCRWATAQEQALNRTNNFNVEFNGKLVNCSVLARQFGLNPSTLHQRLKTLGWSLEKALNTPVIGGKNQYCNDREAQPSKGVR